MIDKFTDEDRLERIYLEDPNQIYEAFVYVCSKTDPNHRLHLETLLRNPRFPMLNFYRVLHANLSQRTANVILRSLMWKRNMFLVSDLSEACFWLDGPDRSM